MRCILEKLLCDGQPIYRIEKRYHDKKPSKVLGGKEDESSIVCQSFNRTTNRKLQYSVTKGTNESFLSSKGWEELQNM